MLYLLTVFLLCFTRTLVQGADCPCVDKKIWHDKDYGDKPNIDVVVNDVGSFGEPQEIDTCVSTFDMTDHKRTLENFVSKHCTYFIPPQSGDYKFFMSCDNTCTLFVDESRLINISFYTNYHQWDKYPEEQVSGLVSLTKGTCIELCAVQADGQGRDHVSVGVQYPDGTIDRPMSNNMCNDCPCASSPCVNGGVCSNDASSGGYSCDCSGTCFTGTNCEIAVDSCSAESCLNGGSCSFDSSSEGCFSCQCTDCFQGETCQKEVDACSGVLCLNGGICAFDSSSPSCYSCICSACYEGAHCEKAVDSCGNSPCENGGECSFNANADSCFSCECTACFSGEKCDLWPCQVNQCPEDKTCYNEIDKDDCFKCKKSKCQKKDGQCRADENCEGKALEYYLGEKYDCPDEKDFCCAQPKCVTKKHGWCRADKHCEGNVDENAIGNYECPDDMNFCCRKPSDGSGTDTDSDTDSDTNPDTDSDSGSDNGSGKGKKKKKGDKGSKQDSDSD